MFGCLKRSRRRSLNRNLILIYIYSHFIHVFLFPDFHLRISDDTSRQISSLLCVKTSDTYLQWNELCFRASIMSQIWCVMKLQCQNTSIDIKIKFTLNPKISITKNLYDVLLEWQKRLQNRTLIQTFRNL